MAAIFLVALPRDLPQPTQKLDSTSRCVPQFVQKGISGVSDLCILHRSDSTPARPPIVPGDCPPSSPRVPAVQEDMLRTHSTRASGLKGLGRKRRPAPRVGESEI